MLRGGMNQDRSVTESTSIRVMARLIVIAVVIIGTIGLGLAINDGLSPWIFVLRVLLMGLVAALYCFLYSRLTRFAGGLPPERQPLLRASAGPLGMAVLFSCAAIMFWGHP